MPCLMQEAIYLSSIYLWLTSSMWLHHQRIEMNAWNFTGFFYLTSRWFLWSLLDIGRVEADAEWAKTWSFKIFGFIYTFTRLILVIQHSEPKEIAIHLKQLRYFVFDVANSRPNTYFIWDKSRTYNVFNCTAI